MPKKSISFTQIALVNILLYFLLLLFVKLDSTFAFRWLLLLFYFFTILLLPIYFILCRRARIRHVLWSAWSYLSQSEGKKDFWLFLLIAVLAISTRFLFLKEMPFLTWGDELWETGVESLSLYTGEIKNLYLVGYPDLYRVSSMGLVIPLIPVLFAPLYAHTPYMYRLPAALFGLADIILVYLACRVFINRWVAFFAALSLIGLPIHLYFSRTELVVISDAFLTTVTICLLYITRQRFLGNVRWLSLMGLWVGFTATFHPAVRITSLVTLGITFGMYLYSVITNKKQPYLYAPGSRTKFAEVGKYAVVLSIFVLIGFGPKILFTKADNWMHQQKNFLLRDVEVADLMKFTPDAKEQFIKNVISIFRERYRTSFLGYINEPLNNMVEFHYTEDKPLLPSLLAVLFLIGLVSLVWTSAPLAKWFGLFVLLIPLTHSVLAPDVNWSYRAFVASSSAAVMIGIGLWQITSRIHVEVVRLAIVAGFVLFLFNLSLRFFILEPHFYNRPVEQYMTTHLAYFLQSHLDPQKTYRFCIRVAPEQLKFMNWVHAHNQYKYFVPQANIEVTADPAVPPNTLYLEENCQPKSAYSQYIVKCSQTLYSVCPKPTVFRQQFEPDEINKDFIFYY